MRISCEQGDAGFDQWALAQAFGARVIVFLDGVEQANVLTADGDEGWLRRAVLTPFGQMQTDDSGERLLTEVAKGAVKIIVGDA